MKNFIKILLLIFLVSIFSLIFYVGSKDISNTETLLLSIILTLVSVAATWVASHYYSEDSYKKIVDQVNLENQSKLKTYALKAAEKVNNLSKELSRLSAYLQDELDQDFNNQNEENFSKEERIKSVIHIVNTLKSINDTSLSDWQGVISEELEEKEEKEREREEMLSSIIERYEDIISGQENFTDRNYSFIDKNENTNEEIRFLNKKIDMIIKEMNSTLITSKITRRKNIKEEVKKLCPYCKTEITYKQRPRPNSVKNFKCACGGELIGRWDAEKNFYLEVPQILKEEIECPCCSKKITINLSSKLHSKLDEKCEHCDTFLKITRRANDLLVKKVGINIGLDEENKLTEELIEKVKKELPAQPWPSGTHTLIADKLGVPPKLIKKAMDQLIKRGDALTQVNGKIFIE